MSISHWVFWVTRPRLEVRLRNSPVDSNGSLPARSFARIDRKNHSSTATGDDQDQHQPHVVVGRQDAHDHQHQADGRQDRAAGVERARGSGGSGSLIFRLSSRITR